MSDHDTDDCPHLVRASLLEAENARLKAEVERLTKAGDELGEWFMDIHPSKKKWNAAKEGKQP